jgi:ABC-type Fe3+-hydroxamate transport system substrate-binding protein
LLSPRERSVAVAALLLGSALAACSGASERQDAARDAARDASRAKDTADSGTATTPAPRVAAPADTDDFGAPLPLDASSSARIVSLNPTATEVLYAIGGQSLLVGRSAWDEFPAEVKSVPSVGDGIRPNVEAVLARKPTLVIMYATAENRAAAEALARAGVRTMSLRVDHIADFMTFTTRLGRAIGKEGNAAVVRDSVQRTLEAVRAATRGATPRRVVWPVWLAPTLVIGGGSFIDELITIAGGENVFHEFTAPSPPASIEEIAKRDPDLVAVSESMRSRLRNDVPWRAVRAVRDERWVIIDPDLTGRPSVVLGMAAVRLARAFHPDRAAALPH